MTTKPPLGLRPRRFALEDRQREILEALARYNEAGEVPPREWLDELMENYDDILIDKGALPVFTVEVSGADIEQINAEMFDRIVKPRGGLA